MSAALTARSHNNATLATLYRVLVLPWLALGLAALAGNFVGMLIFSHHAGWTGLEVLPGLLGRLRRWLRRTCGSGLRAWWNLRDNFRALTLKTRNSPPTNRPAPAWFRRAAAAVGDVGRKHPGQVARPRLRPPVRVQ